MENTLLKTIKVGIFLIFLTPLILGPVGLTLSAYPKAVYFRSLVEILLIFYIALILLNRKYIPKIHLSALSVIIFISTALIVSLLGFNFYRSFFGDPERTEGIILYMHLMVFILIVMGVFTKKENWITAFKASVFIGGISSFAAIIQKLNIFKFYGTSLPNRMSGTLSNPDFFGPYIVLLLFITFFVFLSEKAKDLKFVWGVIIFIDALALYYTLTRGAWLGFIVGMGFVVAAWLISRPHLDKRKKRYLIFAGLALFILAVSFFLFPNFPPFKHFSNLIQSSLASSVGSRLHIWGLALKGWWEKPVLGWGLESFSYVFDRKYNAQFLNFIPEGMYFDRPHNKILELMNDAGIIGLLAYFFIFFAAVYTLFKNKDYWRESSPPNKNIFIFLLTGFFIAYLIQGLFYFDTICSYIILYLVLGFINNVFLVPKKEINYSPEKIKKRFSRKEYFVAGLSAVVLLGILYGVNIKPTIVAAQFPHYAQYEKKDIKRAYAGYSNAIKTKTIYDKDFRLIFVERSIYLLENGLVNDIEEEVVGNLLQIRPLLAKDVKSPDRRPNSSYEYLARISERAYFVTRDEKNLEDMESALKAGIEFNSELPTFYQLMGELRIIQNRYEEGEDYFAKMHALTPKHPRDTAGMYKKIGVAYAKANDIEKTIENFKKALDVDYDYKKATGYSALDGVISFIDLVAVIYYRDFNDFDSSERLYIREMEAYPDQKKTFQAHIEALRQDYNKKSE
jgi:O-antigen ligase/tetratricopeptide (TPR) repeat protein